jgi:hypothetical protein
MASQDRVHRQFVEAIRGTQSYVDPHSAGTSWELPNEYEHVWKTASDEFILTNDVNYDPNVANQESKWERMRTAP